MKEILLNIIEKYLDVFPDEKERQQKFIKYIKQSNDEEITKWNNFEGHIVAGGFVYSEEDQKFLVLYHKDLQMFLYPGGHVDSSDKDPLEAAIREISEETGLNNITELTVGNNELIPIDIDTQRIKYNERLNLPAHDHFDFRYLFVVDQIVEINVDIDELLSYKWIDIDEFSKDPRYGWMTEKIKKVLMKHNKKF